MLKARIQLKKDINYNSITISLVLKNTTNTMDVNIYAKDLTAVDA